jgi:hypothetical protein
MTQDDQARLESLSKRARDLANELFGTDGMECRRVGNGPTCIMLEDKRSLTKHERSLGWARRPFSAYDPDRMCCSCVAYWHAELAAQELHRFYCLKVKFQ